MSRLLIFRLIAISEKEELVGARSVLPADRIVEVDDQDFSCILTFVVLKASRVDRGFCGRR